MDGFLQQAVQHCGEDKRVMKVLAGCCGETERAPNGGDELPDETRTGANRIAKFDFCASLHHARTYSVPLKIESCSCTAEECSDHACVQCYPCHALRCIPPCIIARLKSKIRLRMHSKDPSSSPFRYSSHGICPVGP